MPQGVPESARGACVQAVPTAPTPASQPLAALAPAATPAAQPVAAATPAPPAVLATPSSAWQHVLSTNPLSVQAGPALCGQASLETSLNAHVTKTYSEQRLLKHLRSRLRLNKDCHRTSVPATALGTAARRRRARVQPTACRWGARWWAAPARSSSARSRTRPTPWQARATQRCARPSAPRPRPTRAAAPTPRRSSTGCARAVHRRGGGRPGPAAAVRQAPGSGVGVRAPGASGCSGAAPWAARKANQTQHVCMLRWCRTRGLDGPLLGRRMQARAQRISGLSEPRPSPRRSRVRVNQGS